MKSRQWVRFFLTTLLIGGLSTFFVAIVMKWEKYIEVFTSFDGMKILTEVIWLVGMGFLFSLVSQMGFFAYLTVHRFGLGFFRTPSLWNIIQVFLIVIALVDFLYLQSVFSNEDLSFLSHLLAVVCIGIVAVGVAYKKAKETNKFAFVPTLFFMIVVTMIEWVPALKANNKDMMYLMIVPLLVCNMYQVLKLHKITQATMTKAKPTKQKSKKVASSV
ncbi:KinB-signaling pathway activation protein [Priestia taiwanensis]|uniref:KinB-signaling pathway activation protein n=1 Tax=Priestia taiwanensis TaxID=1347902 RepID=A0A917EUB1_9BACI|nr:KinB-signaling pathway activation protein [Priestia taiwanensis]MBM7365079.1 KinB signaling pathway activation protein [Priestia taiwanensis]GGE84437.1 KinB-signaling pathway activation protein [Priestia taiwanensis]